MKGAKIVRTAGNPRSGGKKEGVHVGDIVFREPHIQLTGDGMAIVKKVKCQVVYVHPKGRYHTVKFKFRHGSCRESYQGVEK